MKIKIATLRALQDNYIYVLQREGSSQCLVIDPTQAAPVHEYVKEHHVNLGLILNTHHHHDHVGGNHELASSYGAMIYCSDRDLNRVPLAQRGLHDGDVFSFDEITIQVIAIPGHTDGQIAYYIADAHALFAGDTVFSMGCGRLFEGTPETMWESLSRIMNLPDETRLFFGHEYTERNGAFAKSVEPGNEHIDQRITSCQKNLRDLGYCPAPTLREEKLVNPFFRVEQPVIRKSIEMHNAKNVEVFAKLREMRNSF